MRDDVIGRANVEDTPELLAYYDELEALNAGALWTVANKIEPWFPQSDSVPLIWRYRELREHVLRSVSLVSPEKAGRRVIYLSNPKRRDVTAIVGWLYSGLQVMHAGEVATAHQAFGLRAALHHGGQGRLHHRRTATRLRWAPTTSCSRPTAHGTSTASPRTAPRASGRTVSTSR